jgi:hypothetical protein
VGISRDREAEGKNRCVCVEAGRGYKTASASSQKEQVQLLMDMSEASQGPGSQAGAPGRNLRSQRYNLGSLGDRQLYRHGEREMS